MRTIAVVVVNLLLTLMLGVPLHAECEPVAAINAFVLGHGGAVVRLSDPQWQYARGIWVRDPDTPPGLPYGDHALLLTLPAAATARLVFVDADTGCQWMSVPQSQMQVLMQVGEGDITHPPKGP